MINVEIWTVWQSNRRDIFGKGSFFPPFTTDHLLEREKKKKKHIPALEGFLVYLVGKLQWLTFIESPPKCWPFAKC